MTYRKIAFLVSVIAIAVALVAVLPSADAAEGDTFKVSTSITGGTTNSIEILYHIVSDNEVEVSNSNGVTSSNSSYMNCNGALTIPSEVTYEEKEYTVIGIGYCAFWNTPMTSITLPDTLEYIGTQAFSDIHSLSSITIPASVTSIDYKAFSNANRGDDKLTTITFASGSKLTTVGDNLFEGRTALENVEIPAGVTDLNIETNTVSYNISLKLGALNAWDDAADVVTFAEGSPFSKDEYGLLYDGTTLVANLNKVNDSYIGTYDFIIKDGTTAIGDVAMISKNNGWTIGTIIIPSSVETIGKYAFRYSSTISTVIMFEGDVAPTMNKSFVNYGMVFVPEGYDGYEDYFALSSINVVKDDGTTTNTTTKTEKDEETEQTITTTTITTKDETGNTVSIQLISTTSQDSSIDKNTINTTATIQNSSASVSVFAISGENLNKISGQITLIEGKLDGATVDNLSVTISDNRNGAVVLTSESLEYLCNKATSGSIVIEMDSMAPQDYTPEQGAIIGDYPSYNFSAILKTTVDTEDTEQYVSDLGDYVTVYIPYSDRMGDVSSIGIYHVEDDGTKTLMESEFVNDKFTDGSFRFRTNHFSVFAALPLEGDEDSDIPLYNPDDEHPFIPPAYVTGDNSDETTLYIACCAAAAVVALLAIILVMNERKR